MGALFAVALFVACVVSGLHDGARQGKRVDAASEWLRADTVLREDYVVGSFQNATRIAQNAQGWLYVVDTEANTVFQLRSPRDEPRSVGGYGWGATSFDRPLGLTTDGLSLYVADYNNHRIQRFDRNLNFLSSFSTRDTNVAAARFGFPSGVALSRLGDLFILDSENLRVVKFTASLQFERSFGGIESKQGRLRAPRKILLAPQDRVMVLDDDRLVVFDYFGNFISSVGDGILKDARGFDASANAIVVAAEDSLLWFNYHGALSRIQPLSEVVASAPLSPLQDVVMLNDRVLLLTPHRIVSMTMVAVP